MEKLVNVYHDIQQSMKNENQTFVNDGQEDMDTTKLQAGQLVDQMIDQYYERSAAAQVKDDNQLIMEVNAQKKVEEKPKPIDQNTLKVQKMALTQKLDSVSQPKNKQSPQPPQP